MDEEESRIQVGSKRPHKSLTVTIWLSEKPMRIELPPEFSVDIVPDPDITIVKKEQPATGSTPSSSKKKKSSGQAVLSSSNAGTPAHTSNKKVVKVTNSGNVVKPKPWFNTTGVLKTLSGYGFAVPIWVTTKKNVENENKAGGSTNSSPSKKNESANAEGSKKKSSSSSAANPIGEWVCQQCGRVFVNEELKYKRHLRAHKRNNTIAAAKKEKKEAEEAALASAPEETNQNPSSVPEVPLSDDQPNNEGEDMDVDLQDVQDASAANNNNNGSGDENDDDDDDLEMEED